MKRYLLFLVVILLLCAISAAPPFAASGAQAPAGSANTNPGVIPVTARVAGLTYADWGARWWQWALSYSREESPLTDTTGERAWTGQSGPVFFLCGLATGAGDNTVDRTITIPRDTTLFVPVVNFGDCRLPCCDDVYGECTMTSDQTRDLFLGQLDGMVGDVTALHASIDGRPLQNLFSYLTTTTEFFSVTFAENNPWWCPAGTTDVNLQAGYYLMLSPLKKGEHTLNFGGASASWSMDVTYHITVP